MFISYRREDTESAARLLYERLSGEFGRARIFMDSDSIRLGDDFAVKIEDAVSSCALLLAIIGPRWASVTDSEGRRRIDNERDLVRMEIETALEQQVRVIPLVVDDAPMPAGEDLPGSLALLAGKQALRLHSDDFDSSAKKLIQQLQCDSENSSVPDSDWMSSQIVAAEPAETQHVTIDWNPGPPEPEPRYTHVGHGRWWWLIISVVLLGLLGAVLAPSVPPLWTSGGPTPAPSPPPPPPSSSPLPPSAEPSPEDVLPRSGEPLPDDVFLLRRDHEGLRRIELIDLDGRVRRVLSKSKNTISAMLTPDRRSVLYLRRLDTDSYSLHAMSADGREDKALFTDGSPSCPILNRPVIRDGLLVVPCQSVEHGPGLLNVMTLDGRLIRELDRGRLGDPAFTRDGRSVIYWRADVADSPAEMGTLVSARVDGSTKPTPITSSRDGEYGDPACSPSNDVVVTRRLSRDNGGLFLLGFANHASPPSQLTFDSSDQGFSWSPDGSRILFRRESERGSDIYLFDNGKIRRVLHNPGYSANPVWTAR
jgi:hypothetical protein